MTLQQLIAALQNMKFDNGQAQPQAGPSGTQPFNGPQIAMQSPGAQNSDGPAQPGGGQEPTGRPGSEHDFGTTDTPFGAKNEPTAHGADAALQGRLGEGESLSTMPGVRRHFEGCAPPSKEASTTRWLPPRRGAVEQGATFPSARAFSSSATSSPSGRKNRVALFSDCCLRPLHSFAAIAHP